VNHPSSLNTALTTLIEVLHSGPQDLDPHRLTEALASLQTRARNPDPPEALALAPLALARHACSIHDPSAYSISPAGLYSSWGRGDDRGVPADAMSLRALSSGSPFEPALTALLRGPTPSPDAWMILAIDLCDSVDRALRTADCHDSPFFARLRQLQALLTNLEGPADPALTRLTAELFVHAGTALLALERQPPLRRRPGDAERSPPWLYAIHRSSPPALERLRTLAAEPGRTCFDLGLIRGSATMPDEPQPQHQPQPQPQHLCCELQIRPLFRSSAGRWIDDQVDGGSEFGPALWFAPGVRFTVLEVLDPGPRGRPLVRLAEHSRLGAHWAGTRDPQAQAKARERPPLYHYTLGRALPGIVDDGEIGVAEALPGTQAPAVWLTTREDWEPSIVKSVVEDGARRELTIDELREHCGGLFRVRVDAQVGALSWARFAQMAEVDPSLVDALDASGRARGADPRHWFCCPWSVPRASWRGIEIHQPERGWVALEL